MPRTSAAKITVVYWIGTRQCESTATTYRGAMRIACRSQNAHGPKFYDASGEQLHDDGNGLATEEDMTNGRYSF
jgi:hypothetical protein